MTGGAGNCSRRQALRLLGGWALSAVGGFWFSTTARGKDLGSREKADSQRRYKSQGGQRSQSQSQQENPTPSSCGDPYGPYVEEMLAHSRGFAPTICKVLSDDQLRSFVRHTLERCKSWGFTWRGPVRTVIEMSFLFGSDFDTDPQFPWAGEILRSPGGQMERATKLYHKTLAYQDAVSGWAGQRALMRWWHSGSSLQLAERSAAADMVLHMQNIFPEKADEVGELGLQQLAHSGIIKARQLGMHDVKRQGFVVGLMFGFGHGCIDDPLLPMIRPRLQQASQLGAARGLAYLQKELLLGLIQSLL